MGCESVLDYTIRVKRLYLVKMVCVGSVTSCTVGGKGTDNDCALQVEGSVSDYAQDD